MTRLIIKIDGMIRLLTHQLEPVGGALPTMLKSSKIRVSKDGISARH